MPVFTLNIILLVLWAGVVRLLPLSEKRQDNIYFGIALVQFLLISGLRSYSVGQDTLGYYEVYKSFQRIGFSGFFIYFPTWEPGYVLTNIIANELGVNFRLYLLIIDAFAYLVIFRFFNRYSPVKWLSVILFVAVGFYFATLHILRQTIAISLILLSYDAILQRNLRKFLILIVTATCFHYTAIFFSISYLLYHGKRISLMKYLLILMAVLMANSFIIELLMNLAVGMVAKYESYNPKELGGTGYGMLVMMVGLMLLGYIFKQRQLKSQWSLIFFSMALGSFMQVMATGLSIFARACWYWEYALMPYIPILITLTHKKESKSLLKVVAIIFSLLFFFLITNTQEGKETWATYKLME